MKVRDTFGGAALADAYVRALTAAPESECPPELEDLVDGDHDIRVVDGVASAVTLKRELRRMLTAH